MGIISAIARKISGMENVSHVRLRPDRKNEINQHWFYRTHSGEYKYSAVSPENVNLVLLNRRNRVALCPVHKKWERCTGRNGKLVFSCGRVNNDMLLDFTPILLPIPEGKIEYDPILKRAREFPPTEEEIEKYRYENWLEINSEVLDENGISRDLVYIRVVENITLSQIDIELVYLDRIKAQDFRKCLPGQLFQKAIRFEYSIDIKKNKMVTRFNTDKIDKILCKRNFSRIFNETGLEITNATQYGIPDNVGAFIADVARSIIRRNWGSNLTLDYAKTSIPAVQAMMNYPFEPGLYDIKNAIYEKFPVGRFDMNGYNSACDFLKVKSFKTVRKEYIKNPLALLSYKGLVQCGFTDKNLIVKALQSPVAELFKWKSEEALSGLSSYCKAAIESRGEGPTLTMLTRNFEDAKKIGQPEICIDTANYAKRLLLDEEDWEACPVKVPKELISDLFKNGLTRNNHTALMQIDYMTTHTNITFRYQKKQLDLEDEIDGYKFRLPKDSLQLYEIGQALHNCVGGYADKVRHGLCTIVYAEKDGAYRLCIEVKNLQKVKQQRADYNSSPTGKNADVMKAWRTRHNLLFNGNSF